jgi:hypothetical protein
LAVAKVHSELLHPEQMNECCASCYRVCNIGIKTELFFLVFIWLISEVSDFSAPRGITRIPLTFRIWSQTSRWLTDHVENMPIYTPPLALAQSMPSIQFVMSIKSVASQSNKSGNVLSVCPTTANPSLGIGSRTPLVE